MIADGAGERRRSARGEVAQRERSSARSRDRPITAARDQRELVVDEELLVRSCAGRRAAAACPLQRGREPLQEADRRRPSPRSIADHSSPPK